MDNSTANPSFTRCVSVFLINRLLERETNFVSFIMATVAPGTPRPNQSPFAIEFVRSCHCCYLISRAVAWHLDIGQSPLTFN
jgi:hypothetical protein